MLCYQCEQTNGGVACTKGGVCGKSSSVAALQDVLLHITKGVSLYADAAAKLGARDESIDRFVVQALFATITNVDFDEARLQETIAKGVEIRTAAKALYEANTDSPQSFDGAASFAPATDLDVLTAQGDEVGIKAAQDALGETVAGVLELGIYGLKGAAAYADHAAVLGVTSAELYAKFHAELALIATQPTDLDALLACGLRVGELNLQAMELLDKANTETYGHPVPTQVNVNPVEGKAILVSGHDLKDLKLLLEQTEGKGINIYTHGEMLPAHGYPELKKHAHLVGNYGGAWQDQQKEFDAFPGAILMTTNCIQKPREAYKARIFTTGLVAWPGVEYICEKKDFSAVIEAALEAEGFTETESEHLITVGFARNAVLGVADKVIEAVKAGAVKHFFLVGGCDGAKSGRNYYTELAEKIPDDCVILTLACGKFRFNKLNFGDIGGIPRLLDVGQCNDAYSAIQIAVALAGAFDCGVNELPLSLVLSWYEQKAVAILLTLLHLGIRNIRIGPSLPAFVTEPVLNVLVEKFALTPITTAEEDLKTILNS